MGDTGRMRAWLLAIAVAILGLAALEYFGMAKPAASFPPYRAGQLLWAEHLLGGLMFGVGMTLGSGCGNKTLIRIGGGNLKSVMVLGVIALIAYFMINPFPGTDQTLFTVLFYPWIRPLAVDMGASQDLGSVLAGDQARLGRLVAGGVIGCGLLALVFKSGDFRRSADNVLGGLVVGLAIVAAWYVTSNVGVRAEGEVQTLQGYVQQWDFYNQSDAGKPADSRPLAPQSFTFINPMGQALGYAASGFQATLLTFGVMSVAGVILGSLLWSLVSRNFRVEWFASGRDFVYHLVGAILMGLGGVLAMGCTIGQAVTGISTLAIGPFISFFGIVLGSALTMKVQYYKMVYETEATFAKALVTALVDFKLLPASLRKLEAV